MTVPRTVSFTSKDIGIYLLNYREDSDESLGSVAKKILEYYFLELEPNLLKIAVYQEAKIRAISEEHVKNSPFRYGPQEGFGLLKLNNTLIGTIVHNLGMS